MALVVWKSVGRCFSMGEEGGLILGNTACRRYPRSRSRPYLLAALLTQGTARLAVSSKCVDNGICQSSAVPINDVGVSNIL